MGKTTETISFNSYIDSYYFNTFTIINAIGIQSFRMRYLLEHKMRYQAFFYLWILYLKKDRKKKKGTLHLTKLKYIDLSKMTT